MIHPVTVDGFVLLIGVSLMCFSFCVGYVIGYKAHKKKYQNRWLNTSN
jgi:hypothetical protein